MKRDGMDGLTVNVSDQDIELLSQYLDGELHATASRTLEARLHQEGPLQSTLLAMQALNQRLRDALAECDSVPESIAAMLEQAESSNPIDSGDAPLGATVLPFPERTTDTTMAVKARWPYALAATFVGAVALTLVADFGTSPQSALPGNDKVVSAALDTLPSGNGWASLVDGRELQPVLSFPHEDGRWCREYLLRGGQSDWRAVACLEGSRWVTQAAGLESYLDPAGAYRAAGADDAEPVAGFISQHAADIALDRNAESALIASGWRD